LRVQKCGSAVAIAIITTVLAGCGWDWNMFDPPDGSQTLDVLAIDAVSDIPRDDPAATDIADEARCGSSGQRCCDDPPRCRTGLGCTATTCGTCSGGTVACAGSCIDTQTDRFNCGFCGRGCSGTNRNCSGGHCVP
jgi:hypothetical protein